MRIKTIENKAARSAQALIVSDSEGDGGFVVGGITETDEDRYSLDITDEKLTGLDKIHASTIKGVHDKINERIADKKVVYTL